jgi:hypothetical protein
VCAKLNSHAKGMSDGQAKPVTTKVETNKCRSTDKSPWFINLQCRSGPYLLLLPGRDDQWCHCRILNRSPTRSKLEATKGRIKIELMLKGVVLTGFLLVCDS